MLRGAVTTLNNCKSRLKILMKNDLLVLV